MAIVGYARVSATDQNLARQRESLGGVDKLFEEVGSGKNMAERPELAKLREYVREGDVVRVASVDRLARSARDLLNLLDEFRSAGVAVEFIDQPLLSTTDKYGEFGLTVLAAVAQLERAMIRERQAEGIAVAKSRGVYERATRLTAEQVAYARAQINLGVPKAIVARELGVGRTCLYQALNGRGAYAIRNNKERKS